MEASKTGGAAAPTPASLIWRRRASDAARLTSILRRPLRSNAHYRNILEKISSRARRVRLPRAACAVRAPRAPLPCPAPHLSALLHRRTRGVRSVFGTFRTATGQGCSQCRAAQLAGDGIKPYDTRHGKSLITSGLRMKELYVARGTATTQARLRRVTRTRGRRRHVI